MFTVRKLANLAGITPRTLHYYDEIGLLKPSRIGENGYRYYEAEALLRLQQILLYRQLDMPLKQIKALMDRPDYDVMHALQTHRTKLRQRIVQLERLVETVDHTIQHLKGEKKMSQRQLFEPFSQEQQAEYEQEAMRRYDSETVKASVKKWHNYTDAEKQQIQEEGNAVYYDMLQVMPQGAGSAAAQAAVERWRRHLENFWVPNDDQLLGLVEGYNNDPQFRAAFDKIDPGLAPFMREAVKQYLEGQRSQE